MTYLLNICLLRSLILYWSHIFFFLDLFCTSQDEYTIEVYYSSIPSVSSWTFHRERLVQPLVLLQTTLSCACSKVWMLSIQRTRIQNYCCLTQSQPIGFCSFFPRWKNARYLVRLAFAWIHKSGRRALRRMQWYLSAVIKRRMQMKLKLKLCLQVILWIWFEQVLQGKLQSCDDDINCECCYMIVHALCSTH